MGDIDGQILIDFFRAAAMRLDMDRQRLCALDGEIGDGDHGTSMANGFAAVSRRLQQIKGQDPAPAQVMRDAASAFIGEVGATVGPLYATGFLEAARLLEERRLATTDLAELIDAIARGIALRGDACLGDKTMLDAWLPAGQAARDAADAGAGAAQVARAAAEAALRGAQATKGMIASRGRAARLQERNLGHLDPGAASAAVILEAFEETVTEA